LSMPTLLELDSARWETVCDSSFWPVNIPNWRKDLGVRRRCSAGPSSSTALASSCRSLLGAGHRPAAGDALRLPHPDGPIDAGQLHRRHRQKPASWGSGCAETAI